MNEWDNFVPFCDTVLWRYSKAEELPRHNTLDRRLCSGQIHVTLTALTPVCISNGKRSREGELSVVDFSRNAQGQACIPGSSLRGLIRQNMQILGLGAVRVGEEIANAAVAGDRKPWEGIPRAYNIRDDLRLDYARGIMGFVRKVKKNDWLVTECYRSRVSVGSLPAQGTPAETEVWPVILKPPRMSDEIFVSREGGSFRLRGTRQYPLRAAAPEDRSLATQGIRPQPAGTRFSGVIRYHNLYPDELGLLLWCLRLEEGCCHTMGLAKGSGCGRMALTIDRLLEYDPAALYSSLTAEKGFREDTERRVAALINDYRREARRRLGSDPMEYAHIQHFFALKRPDR